MGATSSTKGNSSAIRELLDGAINGNQLACILGDSPNLDAFARLRVSNPMTIFDSKQIFDDPDLAANVENQPLFYDNQQTSGAGTTTAYSNDTASTTLAVADTTAGTRVRQTRMRFNYEPGKSQLIFTTFVLGAAGTGITKRHGVFDEKNGLFVQNTPAGLAFVIRSYTTGAAVDTAVLQANWNLDPMDGTGESGVTLDITKAQILLIDYEWLGVGRVRMGWVIDGIPVYCHQFLHANSVTDVYMSTPNLPVRTEISNDGTGAASSIKHICTSIISEGGSTDLGILRHKCTDGTEVTAQTEGTAYAVIGLKLRDNYLGTTIKIMNIALQLQTATSQCEWSLRFNPTVAGTFTYTGLAQSAVQVATGATANTVTGGYEFAGGFIESGGPQTGAAGGIVSGIENAIRLGSLIDGTADSIVLCVRPIGGSSGVAVEGAVTWRELA